MEKGKIFYKVRLTKEFKYPKSMLEKGYEQEDARNKAHNDIYKTINEITNNKFEDIQVNTFFETEVKEDKGWKLRSSEEKSNKVDLEEIVSTFAQTDFEKKFGILNIEENPDLFEFEEGNWFLRANMEKEFSKFKLQYRAKLAKFKVETEMPRRNTRGGGGRRVVLDARGREVSGFDEPSRPLTYSTGGFTANSLRQELNDLYTWTIPPQPSITMVPNITLDNADQVELERDLAEQEIIENEIDISDGDLPL